MADRLTRILKALAIVLTVGFVGWAVWEKFGGGGAPGDLAWHEANNLFEDGSYERAAARYREALAEAPDHLCALRGLARSLHKAGAYDEALAVYDQAIGLAPDFAGTYANRGILLDTMGRHRGGARRLHEGARSRSRDRRWSGLANPVFAQPGRGAADHRRSRRLPARRARQAGGRAGPADARGRRPAAAVSAVAAAQLDPGRWPPTLEGLSAADRQRSVPPCRRQREARSAPCRWSARDSARSAS